MSDVLLVERSDGVATVTLNRPKKMNALSFELRTALVEAVKSFRDDDEVGVVILTGAGRAFCAGLDLVELGQGRPDTNRDAVSDADIVRALAKLRQPIIGAINGVAVTGGFELALACDVLICSTEARFADTHGRVGILPGWGLSQKLPRIIGMPRAKELSLTGNYLEAERAEAWGLASRVVAPDELLPTCRSLAQDMLSCDPRTLRGIKRLMDDGYARPLEDALRLERKRSRKHMRGVSPDAVEERRKGVIARGRQQST